MKGANHAELYSGFEQSQLTCLLETWIRPPNIFSLMPRNEPNPQNPDPNLASGSHGLILVDSRASLLKTPRGDERVTSDETSEAQHGIQPWFRATTRCDLTNLSLSRQMNLQILVSSTFDDFWAVTFHFLSSQICTRSWIDSSIAHQNWWWSVSFLQCFLYI